MKFKFLMSLILAVAIGFIFGKFMFNQYDSKASIKTVFGEKNNKIYVLQQGVYSSKESMEENVTNLISYVYNVLDDKYYVYVAMTKNKENIPKLEGYFKDFGYSIYVKEFNVNNDLFMEKLDQYDEMLASTTESKAIKSIINQTLQSYEELVN